MKRLFYLGLLAGLLIAIQARICAAVIGKESAFTQQLKTNTTAEGWRLALEFDVRTTNTYYLTNWVSPIRFANAVVDLGFDDYVDGAPSMTERSPWQRTFVLKDAATNGAPWGVSKSTEHSVDLGAASLNFQARPYWSGGLTNLTHLESEQDAQTNANELTLMACVWPTNTSETTVGDFASVFAKAPVTTTSNVVDFGLFLRTTNNGQALINFVWRNTSNTTYSIGWHSSTNLRWSGRWWQIVARVKAGSAELYVDGALRAATTWAGNWTNTPEAKFFVGGLPTGLASVSNSAANGYYGRPYCGYLDNLVLWYQAIDTNLIRATYSQWIAPSRAKDTIPAPEETEEAIPVTLGMLREIPFLLSSAVTNASTNLTLAASAGSYPGRITFSQPGVQLHHMTGGTNGTYLETHPTGLTWRDEVGEAPFMTTSNRAVGINDALGLYYATVGQVLGIGEGHLVQESGVSLATLGNLTNNTLAVSTNPTLAGVLTLQPVDTVEPGISWQDTSANSLDMEFREGVLRFQNETSGRTIFGNGSNEVATLGDVSNIVSAASATLAKAVTNYAHGSAIILDLSRDVHADFTNATAGNVSLLLTNATVGRSGSLKLMSDSSARTVSLYAGAGLTWLSTNSTVNNTQLVTTASKGTLLCWSVRASATSTASGPATNVYLWAVTQP